MSKSNPYENECRLLTSEEIKPFCKRSRERYGDIDIIEDHWDIDGLLKAQDVKTASIKDAECREAKNKLTFELGEVARETCQDRVERILGQMLFDKEDVHIFDTSYEYKQVRIDCVFINEDSELWQALKEGKR